MNNSSLVLLLKNFDKQQLKEFSGFVKSPYFNTNKALISLFEYIRKQHPEFNPEKLEKKYAYKKIFGKTEFNDGFLRVLMSNLQHLAEEYIAVNAFRKDSLLKKKFLLDNIIGAHGNRKLTEKILNEGLKEAQKIIPDGPDDFIKMYHMSFFKNYLYGINFMVNKNNQPPDDIYDNQKYLTYYFLLRMLADHFYHLNQSQLINYTPKLIFLDEIIMFLENNKEYLEFPTLNMTYLRVLLLKNNNIEDFYSLKNAFYNSFEKLGHNDSFNIISIIINFCQKNYFLTEDKIYLKEKLEILRFGLEKEINSFEEADYFAIDRFHNMFSTLFELNEVDEAERFINQYSCKLEPDEQNYWINYSNAELCYKRADFDTALKYLSSIKNLKSISNKLSVKSLQLRIYYDAGLLEQAISAADSFRHFLQNESLLTAVAKEQYKNFYSFYSKLLLLRSRDKGAAVNGLRQKLISVKNVIHKSWLVEKIGELNISV